MSKKLFIYLLAMVVKVANLLEESMQAAEHELAIQQDRVFHQSLS